MTLEKLRQLYAEKLEKAKELSLHDPMTKEDAEGIKTLLDESDKVKSDIELMERMGEADKFANVPLEPKAAGYGVPQGNVTAAPEGFKSAGEFFKAVKNAALYPGEIDRRLKALEVKATGMSEGVPADGGYLLQPNMAAGILERIYQLGEIAGRVTADPVTVGNSMTYNGVDETTRANGSRWGGVTGYWVGEGTAPTSSKGKFRQNELKLKKVAALCYATDEQLEDTANLASWLSRVVPQELSFKVEDAIYEGDGVAKPLGIMNSPCLVSVTRTDASKVQVADILNMWSRRWLRGGPYVWLINQDVIPQLLNLNNSYENLFFPAGAWPGTPATTLLGAPVIEIEYASTMGTVGDIMLAGLSQYQVINKGGVRAESSMHVAFTTDEMAYRFIYRIDGQPMWHATLTPFKGSNTQSPFVVLSSASA